MSRRYAVAISVGPVGRFISAGRRSRDLWYGSRLIAEVTRQVALYLQQNSAADLWTPLPDSLDPRNLVPDGIPAGTRFFDLTGQHPHEGPVIPNKVRAILNLSEKTSIRQVLKETENAARQFLIKQLDLILEEWNDSRIKIDLHAFARQKEAILEGDFLELYAGYAPAAAGMEAQALDRAQALRDAGKNSHLFVAPSWTQAGQLRSTMEPGRDSVLAYFDPRERSQEALTARLERHAKGIRADERLDAVALLRRYAAMREERKESQESKGQRPLLRGLPFPPLSRVAADPWIEGVGKERLAAITRQLMALERTVGEEREALHLLSSPSREPGTRCITDKPREQSTFPYDASLLMEGGPEALEKEIRRLEKEMGRADFEKSRVHHALDALGQIAPEVRALHAECGRPSRYYMLLSADGDGIGEALRKKGREDEKELIQALDQFAKETWGIVANTGRGVPFYVGGDELVAYLPLDTALETAHELAERFATLTRKACGAPLSLSLGLVVAHVKHDLRDIRHRGERALRAAKEARRNGADGCSHIQVIESTAGGVDRLSGGPTRDYVQRMNDWMDLLQRGQLSLSVAYGILENLGRMADPSKGGGWIEEAAALRAGLTVTVGDLILQFRRGGRELPEEIRKRLESIGDPLAADLDSLRESASALRNFAHEIILANRLRAVAAQRERCGRDPAADEEAQSP